MNYVKPRECWNCKYRDLLIGDYPCSVCEAGFSRRTMHSPVKTP